jgi:hypothetical protein
MVKTYTQNDAKFKRVEDCDDFGDFRQTGKRRVGRRRQKVRRKNRRVFIYSVYLISTRRLKFSLIEHSIKLAGFMIEQQIFCIC